VDRAAGGATSGANAASSLVLRGLLQADAEELRRIHSTAEVARRWDLPAEEFPWDEPQSTRFVIELDGRVAGMVQFYEEPEPKYRHAGIDLFLDPALHGRGIGSEVVRQIVVRPSTATATTASRSTRRPTTSPRSAPTRRSASAASA